MPDTVLKKKIERINVFAKLSPDQKVRIINLLKKNGHVVGYLGDGINDAAALKSSEVGISVDTAVDIAKESSDIILMEKNLEVLEQGVVEGRKIYANIIKYIKLTASSNFGNIFSVLVASAFIPFLPMLPLQILMLNLVYDFSCIAIPWDNVDKSYLNIPRKWESKSIAKFMVIFGPISSIFDIITYIVMFFVVCPSIAGGSYFTLDAPHKVIFIAVFQTVWFLESLWTQTIVIHLIRTKKIPFIQSRASAQVTILTLLGIIVGTVLPYIFVGHVLEMSKLPLNVYPFLALIVVAYMIVISVAKKIFIKKYKELL
jgi:Mg2+-importing ATPase